MNSESIKHIMSVLERVCNLAGEYDLIVKDGEFQVFNKNTYKIYKFSCFDSVEEYSKKDGLEDLIYELNRLEVEAAERRARAILRVRALAKLTKEEKDALDLKYP